MKRLARYFWIIAIIFAISIGVGIIFIRDIYRIKKIIVISHVVPLKGIEKLAGENSLTLKKTDIAKRIEYTNQVLSHVDVELTLPDLLIIHADVSDPAAEVVANDGFYQLDEFGNLIRKTQTEGNYPKIEASDLPLFQYSTPDARLVKAIKILTILKEASIFIDRIVVNDRLHIYTFYTEKNASYIIPYESVPTSVATSLQTIISRFRIDGKFVQSVDLRFDKPIVVLSNGEKISSSP